MKGIIGLIIILSFLWPVAVFSATSMEADSEEIVIVEKGDTLWGIQKRKGVPYKLIAKANNIKAPYVIYPKQELVVPIVPMRTNEWYWENHGADKFYTAKLSRAMLIIAAKMLKQTPAQVIDLYIDAIMTQEPVLRTMEIGLKLVEMLSDGSFNINVVVATKNEAAYSWTVEWDGKIWTLYEPLICHNISSGYKIKKFDPPPPAKEEEEVVDLIEPITQISESLPQEAVVEEECENCKFDNKIEFAVFAGNYYGLEDFLGVNKNVGGYYWGGILRYFPLMCKSENGEIEYFYGFHAAYIGARGFDYDFDYEWEMPSLGLSFKAVHEDWDLGIDLGFAWRKMKGWENLYHTEQSNDALKLDLSYNNESRRNDGKLSFPEFGVELNGLLSLHSSHHHRWDKYELEPNPTGIGSIQVNFRQGLYDFFIDGTNSRITPHFNIAPGYEEGRDASFLQIGFGLKWSWYEMDILTLNPLHLKLYSDGMNGLSNFIVVSADCIYRGIDMSMIKVADEKDYL